MTSGEQLGAPVAQQQQMLHVLATPCASPRSGELEEECHGEHQTERETAPCL